MKKQELIKLLQQYPEEEVLLEQSIFGDEWLHFREPIIAESYKRDFIVLRMGMEKNDE
jgi:hypothetical protein